MASKSRRRRSQKKRNEISIAPITLGCPKNIVDSERMMGLLRARGYAIVARAEDADIVVVNTCGFLQSARSEATDVIEEVGRLKKSGTVRAIVVAGCMVQHERESIAGRFPYVDGWLGVRGREQIGVVVDSIAGVQPAGSDSAPQTAECIWIPDGGPPPLEDTHRVRLTYRHVAYLKIAEGCDRRCSFCAIPAIRGKFASKPLRQVVEEAEQLVADGARELILVAQETTYYGMDLRPRTQLAELLDALDRLDGLTWIRLMYTYPQHFDDALIDRIAGGRRVVPYIDLPLQHASDAVLRNMRRQVGRAETERLLERLRNRIPNLVLRTSMIVGFPGETNDDFEELLQFVRRWRFERLGVFEYSREPGTPAAELPHQVPAEAIRERHDRLLAEQQAIAFAWNESRMGRREPVLIDRYIGQRDDASEEEGAPDVWIGRTYADAPEIDSAVYVTGSGLRAGQLVRCEIVATSGYDLAAVPSSGTDGLATPDSPT